MLNGFLLVDLCVKYHLKRTPVVGESHHAHTNVDYQHVDHEPKNHNLQNISVSLKNYEHYETLAMI